MRGCVLMLTVFLTAAQAVGQTPMGEGRVITGAADEGQSRAGEKKEEEAKTVAGKLTELEHLKVKRLDAQEVVAYRIMVRGQLRIVPARGQNGNGRQRGRRNGYGPTLSQYLKELPAINKQLKHLPDSTETRQIVREVVQDAFSNPPQSFMNRIGDIVEQRLRKLTAPAVSQEGTEGGLAGYWQQYGRFLLIPLIGIVAGILAALGLALLPIPPEYDRAISGAAISVGLLAAGVASQFI